MLQHFETATQHEPFRCQWAAGLTVMAADTGRILSLLRCGRTYCDTSHANTWCNAGGSPNGGEQPIQTALREAREEIMNLPIINEQRGLQPLFYCPKDAARGQSVDFYSYLAIVPSEFKPLLDLHENQAAQWHEWNESPDTNRDAKHPFHPGLQALFENRTAKMIYEKRKRTPWEGIEFTLPAIHRDARRPAA